MTPAKLQAIKEIRGCQFQHKWPSHAPPRPVHHLAAQWSSTCDRCLSLLWEAAQKDAIREAVETVTHAIDDLRRRGFSAHEIMRLQTLEIAIRALVSTKDGTR